MLEGEEVYQDGYLGLPFHRVYFNDNSVHVESSTAIFTAQAFGLLRQMAFLKYKA